VHVRIERTWLTTDSGTRVVESEPESFLVESSSPSLALIEFVTNEGARLLGASANLKQRLPRKKRPLRLKRTR
jgi:hypothetical protein